METTTRLLAATGIFLLMVCLEVFIPRRSQAIDRKHRWPINLGLAFLNMAVIRILIGGGAYLSAIVASENSWGLFNQLQLSIGLKFVLSLLFLDFAIYCQHILSHKWSWLWRLHQVHHTDLAFDATTAVRFHPLEILLSMFYKIACVYLIGATPEAVILFEIILNGAATFNHSNIKIPEKLDKFIRLLIITPDMHRIHHSTKRIEMDSNFGFSISCWDRLCGTYVQDPEQEHTKMSLGIKSYRNPQSLNFLKLLKIPFEKLNR